MNRNCDTLFYDKVFFPLKPFLEEVFDEGKLFKVGVLPGTILFPDIDESYHLLGEDIEYYNLKEGEGLFLFLQCEAKAVVKRNEMQFRDPNLKIVCVLDPEKEEDLELAKEIEDEKERGKRIQEINKAYELNKQEEIESSIRYYAHNTVAIPAIKLSIIVKQVSTVLEMHKQSGDSPILIEQHYLLASIKNSSFSEGGFFEKPQLYINFDISDKITKTDRDAKIVRSLSPNSSIYFNLKSC